MRLPVWPCWSGSQPGGQDTQEGSRDDSQGSKLDSPTEQYVYVGDFSLIFAFFLMCNLIWLLFDQPQ